MKQPAVYILASDRNGTLYIGCTSHLQQRIWQHREGLVPGFTKDHSVTRLVYFELHADMRAAVLRERQLKKWNRLWKLRLIEEKNPHWLDLFESIV
ncbi:MAG: GIY-YIG nuclease family protein [Steroidobacteraceae bacterium]